MRWILMLLFLATLALLFLRLDFVAEKALPVTADRAAPSTPEPSPTPGSTLTAVPSDAAAPRKAVHPQQESAVDSPGPSSELVIHGVLVDVSARDEAGNPVPPRTVPGAKVYARFPKKRVETETDAQGRFEFRREDSGVRPMSIRVGARAAEPLIAATAVAEILTAAEHSAEVRLVLDLPPKAHGFVRDPTGAPVPDATVTFMDDEIAVTSREDGSFLAEGVVHMSRSSIVPGLIAARKEGWTTLIMSTPSRDAKTGLWRPVEIVMAQKGSLSVSVVDSLGRGAAGARVEIEVSPREPFHPEVNRELQFDEPTFVGATGPYGRVSLEGVPIDCRLRITVEGNHYDWQRSDGSLVKEEAADELEPPKDIVIGGGRPADFVLRQGTLWKCRGTAREPDGSASLQARVSLYVVEEAAAPVIRRRLEDTRTDETGQFEFELVVPSDCEHLLVIAQSVHGERPPRGMFSSIRYPDPIVVSRRYFTVADGDRVDLSLNLTPQPDLTGQVVDHEGQAVAGIRLSLREHSTDRDLVRLGPGRLPIAVSQDGGTFRFKGVPPGSFNIVAEPSARGAGTKRNVAAGDANVFMRLDAPTEAR